MRDLNAAAEALREAGFKRLVACRGKAPNGYQWQHGGWRSRLDTADGIGIQCGLGLVILDLDSAEAITAIATALPHILDTLSLKTTRGIHLYYRTVRDEPTRHYPGADLLGAGSYALAIGADRELIPDRPMRLLTTEEILAIDAVFRPVPATPVAQPAPAPRPEHVDPRHDPIIHDYQQAVAQTGSRNIALYRTVSSRRPDLAALRRLEAHFVTHRKADSAEDLRARQAEARVTIASALKRPRYERPVRTLYDGTRQWLTSEHRFAGTRLAELVDAVLDAGHASKPISRVQIMRISRERGIGLRTFDTLRRDHPELVSRFFTVVSPPPGPPPAYAGDCDAATVSDSHLKSTVSSSRKMSSLFCCVNARLAAERTDTLRFGAWSSPLSPALCERSHPRTYREALYSAHLERTPARAHKQAWLAAMLGISARTVRNYNDSLQITRIDCYDQWHVRAFEITERLSKAWYIYTPDRCYPATEYHRRLLMHNNLARIRHLTGQYLRTPQMIAREAISHRDPVESAPEPGPTHERIDLVTAPSSPASITLPSSTPSPAGDAENLVTLHVETGESTRITNWQTDPWSMIGHTEYVSYTARDGSLVVTTADRANMRQKTAAVQRMLSGISQRNARQLIRDHGYTKVRQEIAYVTNYGRARNPVGMVISRLRKAEVNA